MGNYLCRWPNGDVSLVFGSNRTEVLEALDEVDDPSNCELIPVRAGALHLKLQEDGTLQYEGLSEELMDAMNKAYPIIDRTRAELANQKMNNE